MSEEPICQTLYFTPGFDKWRLLGWIILAAHAGAFYFGLYQLIKFFL